MRSAVLVQMAMCLASVTTVSASWQDWLPHADSVVHRRADGSSQSSAPQTSSAAASQTSSASFSNPSANPSSNPVEGNTAQASTTGRSLNTAVPQNSSMTTQHADQSTYPIDSPAGGVSMLTPATTALPTPLYQIGDHVTFAWNYTSLLGTPTAVDVLLSCSTASSTWTLTQNMSFHPTAHYTWDSQKQATDANQPLLVDLYTLVIKDSDEAITEAPSPGYLAVYSGLTFGLYTPQPYVPYSEWHCNGCSDASSLHDRNMIVIVLSVSLVTIFSFTWFVAGAGLA